MKKTLFLILLALLSIFMVSCNDNNEEEKEEGIVPEEDENGERKIVYDKENLTIYIPTERNLRVAQFTDLHFGDEKAGGYSNNREARTIEFMQQVVNETNPDLIILTGDILFGKKVNGPKGLQKVLDIMDSFKIPYAYLYGNHDAEELTEGYSKKELHEYLLANESPYLIYGDEYSEKNRKSYLDVRYGVYSLQIRNVDNKDLLGAYMFFDNGYYDSRISSYNSISQGQIDWYVTRVNELQTEYSQQSNNPCEVVPTVIFNHMQLPEYYNAYVSAYAKEYGDDKFKEKYGAAIDTENEYEFIIFQEVSAINGDNDWYEMIRTGAPTVNKTNLFEKMVELGSTKAFFCGHAHSFNFQVKALGIVLGFATQTGFSPAESTNWNERLGYVYNFNSAFDLVSTTAVNEDVEGVLGNGFAIKYLDGTNGDSLFKTEELSADGTYSIDVTMLKQWSRVKFYYKGEELDLVNEYKVTGAYSGSAADTGGSSSWCNERTKRSYCRDSDFPTTSG